MKWIYGETKARGLGCTDELIFDEETWHLFDTFVHTHGNDFHKCCRACWIANRLRIMTAKVRSHKSLAESSYLA